MHCSVVHPVLCYQSLRLTRVGLIECCFVLRVHLLGLLLLAPKLVFNCLQLFVRFRFLL